MALLLATIKLEWLDGGYKPVFRKKHTDISADIICFEAMQQCMT
jgi:hypothetical protein